jgi:outer membrane protein OmpA-like peptidoglycan-associated protein
MTSEQKEYSLEITFTESTVTWAGYYKENSLPGNSAQATLFEGGEKNTKPIYICMSFEKGKGKLYVNKELVMNVSSLMPVMPDKIILDAIATEENSFVLVNQLKISSAISNIKKELKEKGKFITQGIYFEIGKAEIKDESYAVLKAIADVLKEEGALKINIVGFTDNSGKNKGNQIKLSQLRSESVKKYLVEKFAIDGTRIKTDGKGPENPIADNNTSAGRALNRRVEFIQQK